MGWLVGDATAVLSTALLVAGVLLIVLAYYATGAPAARHELHRLTAAGVVRINGGPITLGQRVRSGATTVLRTATSLSPLRAAVDYTAWARAILRDAEGTDDAEARAMVHELLAGTRPDPAATLGRLISREKQLVAAVVDAAALEQASNLPELHRAFQDQQRRRRLTLVRRPLTYLDSEVLGPLTARALDYIGRGTAAGLLVGVVATNGSPLTKLVDTVGTTSLVGGALGAIGFLAYLTRRFPSLPQLRSRRLAALDRYRLRHPLLASAVSTMVLALLSVVVTKLPAELSRFLS